MQSYLSMREFTVGASEHVWVFEQCDYTSSITKSELKKAKNSDEKLICACCRSRSHYLMISYIATCILLSVFQLHLFILKKENVRKWTYSRNACASS